jgi:superfamily II DNA or RNA helicase
MNNSNIIPEKIIHSAEKFFNAKNLLLAKKVLDQARISISFQKGSLERFFIISGIVNDGETREAKASFKLNDDFPNGHVTTHCTCQTWNEEQHCPHSAALFLKFQLNHKMREELKDTEGDFLQRPDLSMHAQGVHVESYGRIIQAPSKLINARPNSTYSSVQYLLTNRKVVNFPLAQDLKGKIKINFVLAQNFDEYQNYPNIENKYLPIFSLLNEAGIECQKVSLFEYLYLFNWDSGEAFQIPNNIKEFIKKTQREGFLQPINEYLRWIYPIIEDTSLCVAVSGIDFKQLEAHDVQYRFSIFTSSRKSFLELNLEIYDKNEKLLAPPPLFNIMLSSGGFLDSFRTKTDAHEFIKLLCDAFTYNNHDYKKVLHSSSQKQIITEWIEFILNHDEIPFLSSDQTKIYYIRKNDFVVIFHALFECFGENASRFSFNQINELKINFQIPKNQLFGGVADFHRRVSSLGIAVFYNQNEVKTWSSNIRFERRKSQMDWFELNLVIDDEDYEVIRNADIGENYLVTPTGLVILDSQQKDLLKFMKKYTAHEAVASELNKDKVKKFSLNFNRARIFELFELKKHGITGALTEEEEALCQNLLNLQEMPHYQLPERYQEFARNYQITGFNWLRFLYENKFGACLADDMGLGKTLQTIMFLQSIVDKAGRVLIVCPVSILINWQNEIQKFSDLDVYVYYGNEREAPSSDAQIILTSYGVMKKESYSTFNEINFDILIMDEVQHLKNIRSQGASAARNIKANFRVCLTGTPVENDLSEFYNIMDLSIPGIWGELSFFRTSSSQKSRLIARKTVKPFILRRTKDEVLKELPEKIENHVYLNFEEEERQHYISTLANIRSRMGTVQQGRKYSEILKSLLQLRQLCLWQNTNYIRSTKIDFLLENLEQLLEEKHKVLVFSQFTTYLDIIQNKIRERNWVYARIDGTQTLKKRAHEVERFQEGDAQVFLISLKAGGVGLNLTAASYIFLMDPWWNPAVENQAIDRAYRIGQENKLTVYRPIIKDSVEEKVLVLQNAKKELFRDLMAEDEENYFSGKLSMDDFQSLLT